MIFSKLFQPKYKHKDPLVRIQAIGTLSAEESQHKSVLHELAFNDSDNRVSVAALNKLNNFDLWWKMMEISKDERLARHARSKVEDALLGKNDIAISPKARNAFIKECKNNSLLETLLQKHAIEESDTDIFLSVLNRLNKAQLTLRTLLNTPNKALQEALFDKVYDEAELARIVKKAKDSALVEQARQRLERIQTDKLKPIQLEKEVKLTLSKLLALAEESDFQKFQDVWQALQSEFQAQQAQFNLLATEQAQSLLGKYQEIEHKLKNKSGRLRGDWDVQQELARTSAALKSASQRCENVLSQVESALSSHAADITLGELESFNEQISQAEQDLNDMLSLPLTDAERRGIEDLINKLMTSRTSLDSLPALQQALTQGEEVLQQIQKLSLPDDVSQIDAAQMYLNETAERWQDITTGFKSIWPKALQQRWSESQKEWKKALQQLRKELQEQVSRVRGRLNGIEKAIAQGRFKNAMRNYEQIKQDYLSLPEGQQVRLSRQFDKVKEQIENLQDWQAYIATPRKPELLKEIEQLVLNPLDPETQAERVKELRKEWNALGVVANETDDVLNNAFNLACEEAFKPCREFYAEQEKQRLENLEAKQKLLAELQQKPTDDVVELSKALRQMQTQWKQVGAVDYKDLEPLNARYQQVVNPLKDKVNQFYQDNAQLKQNLLQKAEALLSLEDWKEATEAAKKIQQQWKQIEFAGQRLENKLWSDFRAINDKIFAKRESAVNEQNDAAQARLTEIERILQDAQKTLNDSSNKAEIEQFLNDQWQVLSQEIQSLPRKLNADVFRLSQQIKSELQEKLLYLGDSQRTAQYQAVFEVLAAWQQSQVPESATELPNYWRQAFHTATLVEHELSDFNRHQLVILLELLQDKTSPDNDEAERKQVQLQLMTLKLQEGINLDTDEILKVWISLGPLSGSDVQLLPRLKTLFGI
ncbi:DUF349 domain-containing protein [Planctobacterium marinum]|uniref:DUF349 domain-containing protein n=1 Tax=Planctobacterium marinum TaxID=1631968 RepID=UPI001E63DC33|nr:DUF349 domain-containing protein [Planctobacterium marinum]MCC2607294.1 DUF349 domain-containing protein [Planctobacterium marinum]